MADKRWVLVRAQFQALGGPNEIQLFHEEERAGKSAIEKLIAETEAIEAKYSRYRPESIISRINSAAGGDEEIQVDDETAALLDYAAAAHRQSGGLFDITTGVLRRIWNFKSARLPTDEERAEVCRLIGWQMVEWRRPAIRLPHAGMEIDFGGIGKEFAADRLANLALELGVKSALVNLGGDIRLSGERPDGTPWSVGIADPRDPERAFAHLLLRSGAVTTSGDYQRFFEHDGIRYCHILNPKTGQSAVDLRSVTVSAPSCLVAGTVTTVAMLKGRAGWRRYLAELGLPYLVVDRSGQIHRSTT